MSRRTPTYAQSDRKDSGKDHSPTAAGRLSGYRAVLVVLCLVLGLPTAQSQQPAGVSAYEVKAAFLFHFPNFVEWSSASLPDTAATLNIGILGEDPFGTAFQAIEGKTVQDKKLVLKRSGNVEDLLSCHILFISSSEKKNIEEILTRLGNHDILTVGETEGFARKGVIINFFLEKKNVRFEINVDAATRSNLKLSSRLLRLAHIIREPQSEGQD